MVKKQPVGAHYGWREWLAQRVTAVIMAIFAVLFFGYFLIVGSVDYAAWKGLFSLQKVRLLVLLFLLSVYYHAWIGMRDVLMDYIKPTGLRILLQTVVILVLTSYTIWSVSILWSN